MGTSDPHEVPSTVDDVAAATATGRVHPGDVRFRQLVDADLPLLHRWLNDPGVVRWWEGDDVSWDAVERDHGVANPDPVEHWLAVVEDQPVGWIQCYAIAWYPDESEPQHWIRLGLDPGAAGIDYLVGEAAARGRGLGSAMIDAFVDRVVFGRHPTWEVVAASPQLANVASWRALANAGFVPVGDFEDEHGTARLMARPRRPGRPVTVAAPTA